MTITNFTSEDLARLHGSVMHSIDEFEGNHTSNIVKEFIKQRDILVKMMLDDHSCASSLSLPVMLQCIAAELLREIEERRAMTDGNMLSQRYRYAGHLEALRAKIETMMGENK